jgi:2-polyprenyl-3-methyl-5-hydroxy-6-metoxy-1,4-benzoquinol methylase
MSYKINKCPLCDSNKLHNLDNKLRNLSTYQVIKCKNCELLFLDKIYYTSQEQLDELYEEMYSEEYYKDGKNDILSNFKDKLPYQKIRKERIDSYLKQDSRVLDVGSGPGYFLEEIRDKVAKVSAIEKNTNERFFVNENLNINCYKDCSSIKGVFDVIVLNQILEHIYDPINFLKELKTVLAENGVFVIEVPSVKNPLVSLYKNNSFTNFWFQEPHLWYFSEKTLKMFLEKAFGASCVKSINTFQESSFINHYNWVIHNKKSKSRAQATTNSFPLTDIDDGPMHDRLEEIFVEFNIKYKDILQDFGFGDTMLMVVKP